MLYLTKIKVLDRNFYKVQTGNIIKLYTLQMKPVVEYKTAPINNCSVTLLYQIIFNIHPLKGKLTRYKIAFMKRELNMVKSITTFQNITKTDCYDMLLKIGFIDLYRLPGQYVASGYDGNERNVGNIISVMGYNNHENFYKEAIKKTKKLLANGENL